MQLQQFVAPTTHKQPFQMGATLPTAPQPAGSPSIVMQMRLVLHEQPPPIPTPQPIPRRLDIPNLPVIYMRAVHQSQIWLLDLISFSPGLQ